MSMILAIKRIALVIGIFLCFTAVPKAFSNELIPT